MKFTQMMLITALLIVLAGCSSVHIEESQENEDTSTSTPQVIQTEKNTTTETGDIETTTGEIDNNTGETKTITGDIDTITEENISLSKEEKELTEEIRTLIDERKENTTGSDSGLTEEDIELMENILNEIVDETSQQ